MALLKIISAFILIFVLSGCGDRKDERVSKGHRDAIKIQCEDASNIKACGLEVRENFIEDGNEYADFSELNDDQISAIKKYYYEDNSKLINVLKKNKIRSNYM